MEGSEALIQIGSGLAVAAFMFWGGTVTYMHYLQNKINRDDLEMIKGLVTIVKSHTARLDLLEKEKGGKGV